jgi:DNA (cytosine-5)-methyltransferase 1
MAGFEHLVLIEIDQHACQTLRVNRPEWNVLQQDIRQFSALPYHKKVDLLAGGVPCPPFSIAGRQLGHLDERDLFPEALRLISECVPRAVMIENVRGLLLPRFEEYRSTLNDRLSELGYVPEWRLVNAQDYGVSQSRSRAILIAMREADYYWFEWPKNVSYPPMTVGELLRDQMASAGWEGADTWAQVANSIAPTIVGGSRKHGGPDLGPSRARQAWANLGVDGNRIANEPPQAGFQGMPQLTVSMAALVQGFPEDWTITGRKTAAYRQVGNALPPPVSRAIGRSIIRAFELSRSEHESRRISDAAD